MKKIPTAKFLILPKVGEKPLSVTAIRKTLDGFNIVYYWILT